MGPAGQRASRALAGGPGAVGGSGRERTMCASRAGASGEASWAAAPDRVSCWAGVVSGLWCAGLLAASRWATAAFWAEPGKERMGCEWEKEAGRAGLFLGLGWVAIWVLGLAGFWVFLILFYFYFLFYFQPNKPR